MAATAFASQAGDRQEFGDFLARRREPESLLRRRREAMARYEFLGLPSTRQEAWRFTDVSALAQIPFRRAGDAPVDAGLLPVLSGHHQRLVFVNGRLAPSLSRLEGLPDKAVVTSLGQALLTHPEQVEAYLDRPWPDDNPFAARNGAFWEDGAFIHLPRNTVLEQPLHLVFFAAGEDTVSYPRILLVLEEGAQGAVVADYRGYGRYLTCPLTEIRAGANASLSYHQVQEESIQAWHLGGLRIEQANNSRVEAHLVSTGAQLARTDSTVLLDGEGAENLLNGLTLVEGTQLGDQHLRVEHAKPHCASRQLFKGVLGDKGRSVFDGLIQVHKNAQKTDASQNNRNLLLSRQAQANSNPRLEILADDVKCSHGSSIGFLDSDALFYLRSRGIQEADARAMLVYAFANDVIERIRLVPLRQRLERWLAERLYPAASENTIS